MAKQIYQIEIVLNNTSTICKEVQKEILEGPKANDDDDFIDDLSDSRLLK